MFKNKQEEYACVALMIAKHANQSVPLWQMKPSTMPFYNAQFYAANLKRNN